MSDSYVQIQPDSTGKYVDCTSLTIGSVTVQRQRIVIADPSTAEAFANIAAKGTQASNAIGIQSFVDSGRNQMAFVLDNANGVTAGALATATLWRGNSSLTTATSYSVTSGKTFRINSFSCSVVNTGATASYVRCYLLWSTTTLATTSAVAITLVAAAPAAVTNAGGVADLSLPDGFELPASANFGFMQIASATSCHVTICVTGFEY